MPDFLADKAARLLWLVGRWWLLHCSNRSLSLQFKLARRLAFALSGDEFLCKVMGELVDIFGEDGRAAEIARKMFSEADRDYSVAIVKAAIRED